MIIVEKQSLTQSNLKVPTRITKKKKDDEPEREIRKKGEKLS
jgi:hypothetical protein